MKVFAILTACLMTAAGATYYLSSSDSGCPFGGCPVAQSGGCCATDAAANPDCCVTPCPACATDCLECCAVCEQCCAAGAQVPTASVATAAPVDTDEGCCAACNTPAKLATSAVIAGVTLK